MMTKQRQCVTFWKITSNVQYDDSQKLGIFDLFVPKSHYLVDRPIFCIFFKGTSNLQYNDGKKSDFFDISMTFGGRRGICRFGEGDVCIYLPLTLLKKGKTPKSKDLYLSGEKKIWTKNCWYVFPSKSLLIIGQKNKN